MLKRGNCNMCIRNAKIFKGRAAANSPFFQRETVFGQTLASVLYVIGTDGKDEVTIKFGSDGGSDGGANILRQLRDVFALHVL
jgi:hypothetical protein